MTSRLPHRLISRLRGQTPRDPGCVEVEFDGDYASWQEARVKTSGYDAPAIFDRTRDAIRKVRDGTGTFERDSVILDQPEYPLPLLAGLLRAALIDKGPLSVLDYGGSLGSTYFQCRPFLPGGTVRRWSVVEQAHFVDCGREEFEDDVLRFYAAPDDAFAADDPDVVILSSVLQYLERPYDTLAALCATRPRHVLLDRTPFIAGGRERLTIQTVPAWIYQASYPAWFFSEPRLVTAVTGAGYRLLAGFNGSDHVTLRNPSAAVQFKGFIFEAHPPRD